MKFGIINVFPPARAALDNLRLAEELGFDTLWACDSHLIWNECYSLLGWLAAQCNSGRLQLGTMVTNPATRDPTVIASSLATIQDVSTGRVICGIGRGDSSVRVLHRHPATMKDLESTVETIRSLTSARPGGTGGATRLAWYTGSRIPVYIAAYGPRMLKLAGRIGDGVIIECAGPVYISWALERVRDGARQAHRDPSTIEAMVTTATFISRDRRTARHEVRPVGALVGNHIAEVIRNNGPGTMPADLEEFVAARPEYDYAQHIRKSPDQTAYIPDAIIDRLCIAGTPDECIARINELAQLGVSQINFYAQTSHFREQMSHYASDVFPHTGHS